MQCIPSDGPGRNKVSGYECCHSKAKSTFGCFFIVNLTFNNKFRKTIEEMKNAQAVNLSILEIQELKEAWRLDLMQILKRI